MPYVRVPANAIHYTIAPVASMPVFIEGRNGKRGQNYMSLKQFCRKKPQMFSHRYSHLLSAVEFLVHQMQQEIDVEFEVALKEVHKLMRLKLRLQQIFDIDDSAGAGHLNVPTGALNDKHTDLVAGNGHVDLVIVRHALPCHEHALVRESARAVHVAAKLGHLAAAFQLALVVVLLGKWHQESLFPKVELVVGFPSSLAHALHLPLLVL